jgi:hypothetical protein
VAELLKQAPELVKKYETIEWKREYYRHKKDNNTVLKNQLAKQFGITLELPKLARYESNKSGNYAHIIFSAAFQTNGFNDRWWSRRK